MKFLTLTLASGDERTNTSRAAEVSHGILVLSRVVWEVWQKGCREQAHELKLLTQEKAKH